MVDYAIKLSSIEGRMNKLKQEEGRLLEKRRQEIGMLAERFGLLTLSDESIVGLFAEAKDAASGNPIKLKFWEEQGAKLLKPKRYSKKLNESSN